MAYKVKRNKLGLGLYAGGKLVELTEDLSQSQIKKLIKYNPRFEQKYFEKVENEQQQPQTESPEQEESGSDESEATE